MLPAKSYPLGSSLFGDITLRDDRADRSSFNYQNVSGTTKIGFLAFVGGNSSFGLKNEQVDSGRSRGAKFCPNQLQVTRRAAEEHPVILPGECSEKPVVFVRYSQVSEGARSLSERLVV